MVLFSLENLLFNLAHKTLKFLHMLLIGLMLMYKSINLWIHYNLTSMHDQCHLADHTIWQYLWGLSMVSVCCWAWIMQDYVWYMWAGGVWTLTPRVQPHYPWPIFSSLPPPTPFFSPTRPPFFPLFRLHPHPKFRFLPQSTAHLTPVHFSLHLLISLTMLTQITM